MENNIKYSSKIIVIDEEDNVYVEHNTTLGGKISYFGGTLEKDEDFLTAAIREIKEELGLDIQKEDLILLEKDGPKTFSTGIYIANIYILRINKNIGEIISKKSKVIKTTINNLNLEEKIPFSINKAEFIEKIIRSLNYNL